MECAAKIKSVIIKFAFIYIAILYDKYTRSKFIYTYAAGTLFAMCAYIQQYTYVYIRSYVKTVCVFRKYRQNSRALFERTQKLYLLKHIFFKVCGTQAESDSNFKQKKKETEARMWFNLFIRQLQFLFAMFVATESMCKRTHTRNGYNNKEKKIQL